MSFTRMVYDSCAYNNELAQSVAPGHWIMDPVRYYHPEKCFNQLGIVGGTAVSHINGNLVDLENDLRGQTRPNTHCPNYKYLPGQTQGREYIKPVVHPNIDTSLKHLPACQMFGYGAVPSAPYVGAFSCQN